MIEPIDTTEFLRRQREEGLLLLDTRSPGEYAQGHVPGAASLPLFTDAERAEVGTLYKQIDPHEALLRGLELVGPKMRGLVEQAERLVEGHNRSPTVRNRLSPKPADAAAQAHHQITTKPASAAIDTPRTPVKNVGVYCWRGGSRSSSLAWLLETAGFAVTRLDGGYKAYRQANRDFLEELFSPDAERVPVQLRVIDGPTGSGKTVLLQALAAAGAQVLDLEGIARHKGSAFGLTPGDTQPTSEAAENEIARRLRDYSARFSALGADAPPLWVENESRNIGRVFLPDALMDALDRAPRVELAVPREERLDHIVSEYGAYPPELLAATFTQIGKRLGGEATQQAIAALRAGDLHTAAAIALRYYDKTYAHYSSRQQPAQTERHEVRLNQLADLAKQLVEQTQPQH